LDESDGSKHGGGWGRSTRHGMGRSTLARGPAAFEGESSTRFCCRCRLHRSTMSKAKVLNTDGVFEMKRDGSKDSEALRPPTFDFDSGYQLEMRRHVSNLDVLFQ